MIGIGAKLKWQNGRILYPAQTWDSPSKRRLPRLLVENRALEVGIYVYIEGNYVVFEESDKKVEDIKMEETEQLQVYQRRYQLIPAKFKRQDTYEWLKKPNNALLLFGKDFKYYVLASKTPAASKRPEMQLSH